MFGFRFLGKTHVPHCKNTAGAVPVKMLPPKEVLLPVSQHIGAPAVPIVKKGDYVLTGQKIAEAGGFVSAPIYASVSGKVKEISDFLLSNGNTTLAVVIESDGENAIDENIAPPVVNSQSDLIEAIRHSGIVGLGGAGFPTYVKFDYPENVKIDTLVVNGAECEPYLNCDYRLML